MAGTIRFTSFKTDSQTYMLPLGGGLTQVKFLVDVANDGLQSTLYIVISRPNNTNENNGYPLPITGHLEVSIGLWKDSPTGTYKAKAHCDDRSANVVFSNEITFQVLPNPNG